MDWGTFTMDPRHPSYPLVRGIVADLRRDYRRWRDTVREYELASAGSTPEAHDRAYALAAAAQELAVDIQSYLAEISYHGVDLDVRHLVTGALTEDPA